MNLKARFALLILLASTPVGAQQTVSLGYYCSWNYNRYAPRDIMYDCVSHIAHAFIWPTAQGDIECYENMQDAELVEYAHDEDKKVLISVGGYGHSAGFSSMSGNDTARSRFTAGIVSYLNQYGYDGIDIDWEFPKRDGSDSSNCSLLVKELYAAFAAESKDWIITMAVPSGAYYGAGFDLSSLSAYVEWFGIMTYDMFGSWCSKAGHNAPLYPPADNNNGSVQDAVFYYQNIRNIPKEKLVLGLPFYGIGCLAAGYNAPANGGFAEYLYKDIIPLINDSYTCHWDGTACVPYCTNMENSYYITYDDTHSIRLKCEYTSEENLRGIMMWALGHDDTGLHQHLLETAGKYLESCTRVEKFSSPQTPQKFSAANFPNPFNSSTAVTFCLAEPCRVCVRIFDIHGRQAAVLFNGMGRKGWNRTVFHADDFPSGIYVYHIAAGQIQETGKMLLVR